MSLRKGHEVKAPLTSRSDYLVCPVYEAGELRPFSGDWARCGSCGYILRAAMLLTLEQVMFVYEVSWVLSGNLRPRGWLH